jgi:hypothetical protein
MKTSVNPMIVVLESDYLAAIQSEISVTTEVLLHLVGMILD